MRYIPVSPPANRFRWGMPPVHPAHRQVDQPVSPDKRSRNPVARLHASSAATASQSETSGSVNRCASYSLIGVPTRRVRSNRTG